MKRFFQILILSILMTGGLSSWSQDADLQAFLATMADASATIRYEAWTRAEIHGASAVIPLAQRFEGADRALTQDLKNALWRIVHHAGRPGADSERKQVADELTKLLDDSQPHSVRYEVLDLLGYIGDETHAEAVYPLLRNEGLWEEAIRCLERIPGRKVTEEMEKRLTKGPTNYQSRMLAALGGRKDPSFANTIEEFLKVAQTDLLKLEALEALANAGGPPVGNRFMKEIQYKLGRERLDVVRLKFMINALKHNRRDRAEDMYNTLNDDEVAPHIREAAVKLFKQK